MWGLCQRSSQPALRVALTDLTYGLLTQPGRGTRLLLALPGRERQ